MRANAIALVVSLVAAASTFAGAKTEVVTNSRPALNASMTLGTDSNGCFTWQVSGKVRPEFRGAGATVHLVCAQYNDLGRSLVFPAQCDDRFCQGVNVDACGNFTFLANFCGTSPQLDPSFVCNFVVHVDAPQSPQSCNEPPGAAASGTDPNGSAPCSGGLCPHQ
jgi:hypothetical protein